MNEKRFPITVITHTRNEEADLAACLESAVGWADEIIVMDMESTDQTCEVARKYTDRILSHPNMTVCEPARNAALKEARNEWALYLDADERLTPELKKIIEEVLQNAPPDLAAVQLPYKNLVFGKWIQHAGGWWPGYKAPMLVRKGRVTFHPEVHSVPTIKGKIARIGPSNEREAVEHHTFRTVHDWIGKMNRYTDLEAELFEQHGEPVDWRAAAQIFGAKMKAYLDETGGRNDGTEGWLLSACCAIYDLFTHMKYWERLKGKPGFNPTLCIPPSAAEFLAVATQAAGGSVAAGQATAPAWILPLVNLLKRREGGIYFPGLPQSIDKPAKATSVVLWSADTVNAEELVGLATKTKPGTFIMLGYPTCTNGAELREKLETLFDSTVHFLDPEPETDRLIAFLWKGEKIEVERTVLVTVHRNALRMMGGGETHVFKILVDAARNQRIRADVSAAMRLDGAPYDLVHVVSLYQPDHVEAIRTWNKKVAVTPIYWDGPRVNWIAQVLPAVLDPARTDEERTELLQLLESRELGANDVKQEEARSDIETTLALRTVRDLGQILMPTGENEAREMERMLGSTTVAARTVLHGINPEPFLQGTPDRFVKEFGLKEFVLCVGRIEPMKNQLMLAYSLRNSGRKLVLMGTPSSPEYMALIQHWAGDNLLQIPNQPIEIVASAMKAAACHVLPSWWEVPGLVSIEAAAAGCPVVATDCGTIRDYLGDGIRYCDPASSSSILQAVEAAIANKGSERARAVQQLAATFSIHRTAQSYNAAYKELLGAAKVRLVVAPDWDAPETWQPILRAYLDAYGPEDGVTLCMMVDEPTGKDAAAAAELTTSYCQSEGIDVLGSADIELVDLMSVGDVAGVVATGSKAEKLLQEQFQFPLLDFRAEWASRKTT